jgi:hypothetical protein
MSSGDFTAPPNNMKVAQQNLQKGAHVFRVHSVDFAATQFNPSRGDARFSPFRNEKDEWVPTIYGGANQ